MIVMVLAGAGAYAQDAQGWKTLELSTLYNENNIFGVDDKYKFTPETDGTLVVWAQDYPVKVYAEMSADGSAKKRQHRSRPEPPTILQEAKVSAGTRSSSL